MRTIGLSRNNFTGSLHLAKIPDSLFNLYLNGNKFSGNVVVPSRANITLCLDGNGIGAVIDTDGGAYHIVRGALIKVNS